MSEDTNEQLYWAAQDGRYAEVAACIARGAEPGWTHRLGWAALHWAAAGGHTRVSGLLLDSGWDLEARTNSGLRQRQTCKRCFAIKYHIQRFLKSQWIPLHSNFLVYESVFI